MKMVSNLSWLIVAAMFLHSGCGPGIDKEELKTEILAIHKGLIESHLKNDPSFLKREIAKNYISVGNGKISEPSGSEVKSNFENYLSSVKFSEYRDLTEPIIGLSNDGSLAWSIVRIKAKGERFLEDGSVKPIEYTCAWQTLYERTGNGWSVLTEVSTFDED